MYEPTTPVGSLNLAEVQAVVNTVQDPCSVSWGIPLTITEMGLVREIQVQDRIVHLKLLLTEPTCIFFFDIGTDLKTKLINALGQCEVDIELLSNQLWSEDLMQPEALKRLKVFRQRSREHYGMKRRVPLAVQ
jgi:metal-sulfur cluster biosynthetic enzyme